MRLRILLGAIGLSLQLIGCTPSAAPRSPCPTPGRCLEYGNQDEPASLDPHHVTGGAEIRILGDVFVGLTQTGPDGLPQPGVADRWETSDAGLTWKFHLRPASWSDGTPLTADDFVFAFRRALDPAMAAELAPLLYILANGQAVNAGVLATTALGVSAPAPDVLEVHLSHPAPYLLELATYPIMAPLPRHAVARWGEAWIEPEHYVSDGPYVVRSWRQGDRVHVVKNPHFWQAGALCFDEINYFPTTDSISAERRVARGELDLNVDFQSNRAPLLRARMPAYLQAAPYLSTTYLVFNTRLPALGDRRVRQALAMSIDTDFIARKVLLAGQTPAHSLIPPGTANTPGTARTFWASWPLERRRVQARQLLAAAGYGVSHPLKIEVKYRNQPDPQLFLPAIQADWRAIGVQATLLQNETQVAYGAYEIGDFEVGDAGVTADFNDPVAFLGDFRSQAAGRNYGGYRSKSFDQLLDAADHEADAARRAVMLAKAEQVLLDDAAVAPVYFSVSRALVNPRITGWHSNLSARHPARFLCHDNPWPGRLDADAQALYDTLLENHPGAHDGRRPEFLEELQQGLREARQRASSVRDYDGYWWALRGYAAGFNDGHLRLEAAAEAHSAAGLTWPGFLTGFRGDVQKVLTRARESISDLPPMGARLLSCDGVDAGPLSASRVGAFAGRWELSAVRVRRGGELFLDAGNPFSRRPSSCIFEMSGQSHSYELKWRPIGAAEAEARMQATWQEVHPPTGITQRASGSLWISLPNFDFSPQSRYYAGLNQVLERLSEQPQAWRDARRIVLDLRGNPGGSSHWSQRIAEILWGVGRVRAVSLQPKEIDWRASRGNIDYLQSARGLASQGSQADPRLLAEFTRTIDGMLAAAAAGQPFWRDVAADDPRQPGASPAHSRSSSRRPLGSAERPIYVLTDAACGSACLDAVDLWKALGAIQVGQETAADTFYMDIRRVDLPSGLTSVWFPMKVVRDRPRGWNVPQSPAFVYEGDMADTDAIDRWISGLRAAQAQRLRRREVHEML